MLFVYKYRKIIFALVVGVILYVFRINFLIFLDIVNEFRKGSIYIEPQDIPDMISIIMTTIFSLLLLRVSKEQVKITKQNKLEIKMNNISHEIQLGKRAIVRIDDCTDVFKTDLNNKSELSNDPSGILWNIDSLITSIDEFVANDTKNIHCTTKDFKSDIRDNIKILADISNKIRGKSRVDKDMIINVLDESIDVISDTREKTTDYLLEVVSYNNLLVKEMIRVTTKIL